MHLSHSSLTTVNKPNNLARLMGVFSLAIYQPSVWPKGTDEGLGFQVKAWAVTGL